jgi:hypothetical protein
MEIKIEDLRRRIKILERMTAVKAYLNLKSQLEEMEKLNIGKKEYEPLCEHPLWVVYYETNKICTSRCVNCNIVHYGEKEKFEHYVYGPDQINSVLNIIDLFELVQMRYFDTNDIDLIKKEFPNKIVKKKIKKAV